VVVYIKLLDVFSLLLWVEDAILATGLVTASSVSGIGLADVCELFGLLSTKGAIPETEIVPVITCFYPDIFVAVFAIAAGIDSISDEGVFHHLLVFVRYMFHVVSFVFDGFQCGQR